MDKSVSILLNLASCVSYEEADPLMSLVRDKGELLFYDSLSVKRFPTEKEQYYMWLDELLSRLRNLLESRALSREDEGENIRLIVALDLSGGLFEPSERDRLCFPAQKVRMFLRRIQAIFGENNPLLGRFRYFFVFLESTLPSEKKRSAFYREVAYDGYTGWLALNAFEANSLRDCLFEKESMDGDLPISSAKLSSPLKEFRTRLSERIASLSQSLKQAGLELEFERLIREKREKLRVARDFFTLDYDELLKSAVRKLVGLSNEDLSDCIFFIMKFNPTPAALKRRDEVFLTSLILLLVTMSEEDRKQVFSNGKNTPLFVLGAVSDNEMDTEKLIGLRQAILLCRSKLGEDGELRKKKDGTVKYYEYEAQAKSVAESDSFAKVNEERSDARKKLQEEFRKLRRVPFFFGERPGDWEWYKRVVASADEIYDFEVMNGRPLHDEAKRITEKEMSRTSKECSYAELESKIATCVHETPELMHTEDLAAYFGERKQILLDYRKAVDGMKGELVKLGYLFNLAWISIFLAAASGFCYALHFLNGGHEHNPLWIGAAVLAVLLFLFIGALVSHFVIKQKIEKAYFVMDNCLRRLNEVMANYMDQVNTRIRRQKEADIRRRNLLEMTRKMEEFNAHNLKVDRWETYFDGLCKGIDDTLELLRIKPDSDEAHELKISERDFLLDGFPSMPDVLCPSFREGGTRFSDRTINNVLCFVKNIESTRIDKQC